MNTIYEKVDPLYPDMKVIEKAGEIIKSGGLVAFPTETVYGLGGNALDESASAKIYEAKGRPSIIRSSSTLQDLKIYIR